MVFAEHVKNSLLSIIREMADAPWLFARDPAADFSRERTLGFGPAVRLILSMGGGSLKNELLESFRFSVRTPSASAFCQQRAKLLPEAMQFLFHEFNSLFPPRKSYHGYRLLACDGTDLPIPRDPKDAGTYFHPYKKGRGYNQLHLNALYDLCGRRYADAEVQPAREEDEPLAMVRMIDRYRGQGKTVFIADRGYEAYNIFAHVQEKGMYYLVRVKDGGRGGIVSGPGLPGEGEYDHAIHRILTRRQTKEVKASPGLYKVIRKPSPFDYLDLHGRQFYPMDFRVVRFAIAEGSYECIITNLPEEEFPAGEIKKIYAMRWGVETSFRELKHTIGLSRIHAKKAGNIMQEIYARLALYNYCELITVHVVVRQKDTKHGYQVNYTIAALICRYFLRNDIPPPEVEALIRKNTLPVRPGRSYPRKARPRPAVTFLYRVT